MRLSFAWLREFVDLGARTPEEVARDLTMRTALVEGIERRGDLGPEFVVGRVVAKDKHPAADRLSVCVVDVADARLQVVCGAQNVAAGQTVAVAKPGARLPSGKTIAAAELRGVASQGMICSEQELGLSDDHSGIVVLEDGLRPGTLLRAVAAFSDAVLEIDNKSITHRPDLWGHEGFARELAAIYRAPLAHAALDDSLHPAASGAGRLPVRIEDEAACGRYALGSVSGDLSRPAPAWLRRRLAHCGLRPLSLLVDVSNYVMLEIGQPTHPFDAGKVEREIVVRRARSGESLVTLDGQRRELAAHVLVIADAARATALAGVMGGEASGIGPATREAVIEAAWFDPIVVRRGASAVSLRTDASARFEKGLDPALAERALRRIARVLGQVAPDVRFAPEYGLAGDKTAPRVAVKLRGERCRAKLGIAIEDAEMKSLLERLEFRVADRGGALDLEVPSFRATRDVLTEDDAIEEVGRLAGYERIPEELPRTECAAVELEPPAAAWREASRTLRDRHGFAEVLSYPYAEDAWLERAGGAGDAAYVALENPLQQSARRLRRSLVPAMLEFVDRNVRAFEEVRLFEIGKVFLPMAGERELPYEPLHLAAALAERSVRKGGSGVALRRSKGAIEELAERLGRAIAFAPAGSDAPRWAHPGRCAEIRCGGVAAGKRLGWIAQVHPAVSDAFRWKGECAVFELDLTALSLEERAARAYRPPPRFPAVEIDLSFVAPFSLRYSDVTERLAAIDALVARVEFVDEYTGSPVAAGMRSLTVRLVFRSDERTLEEAEVGAVVERAKAALRESGAELRG